MKKAILLLVLAVSIKAQWNSEWNSSSIDIILYPAGFPSSRLQLQFGKKHSIL